MAGTFEDRFLTALREMSEDTDYPISNAEMRDYLAWKTERYEKTKSGLIAKGLIAKGQGRGGSVRLIKMQVDKKTKPLLAFISYSHVDVQLKNELLKHLKPLERLNLIEGWHDGEIKAGEKWADSIRNRLNSAQLVVLLISVDFINSEYCTGIELKRAMERDANGEAVVIPVIARSCLWHDEIFGQIQATPRDGKAIASFSNLDDALSEVANAIKISANDFSRKLNK